MKEKGQKPIHVRINTAQRSIERNDRSKQIRPITNSAYTQKCTLCVNVNVSFKMCACARRSVTNTFKTALAPN